MKTNPWKVLSIARARRDVITQLQLLNQCELEEALEIGEEQATRGRWEIQEAIERGATIEPGPLTAAIKTSRHVILHSRSEAHRAKK